MVKAYSALIQWHYVGPWPPAEEVLSAHAQVCGGLPFKGEREEEQEAQEGEEAQRA